MSEALKKEAGRPEGSQGKFTGSVKDAILSVFEKMGGEQGLYEWASSCESNKREFYKGFMKMLPREVHMSGSESPESLPFRVIIEGEKDGSDS